MEETTNKISLALEIPEEVTKRKSGRCAFVMEHKYYLKKQKLSSDSALGL